MVELRGIEIRWEAGDKVVAAVVRTEYPDIYEKHELFRNRPVNRGRVRTALGSIYGVPPGQIVWPKHINVHDI